MIAFIANQRQVESLVQSCFEDSYLDLFLK